MYIKLIIVIFFLFFNKAFSFENSKIKIENFYINKYEVTISEFKEFAKENSFITEA